MHWILPLVVLASPTWGWALGWPWLTLLIVAVALPAAEWLWGRSGPDSSGRWGSQFPRLVLVLLLEQWLMMALISSGLSWGETIMMGIACGYVSGGVGIVLAHELGHRRASFDRLIARALLASVAFGHYAIEHNRGHHRAAATWDDPATARRDESLWRFLPRYYSGVWQSAVALSKVQKSPINEAWALMLVTAGLWGLLTWAAGPKALVLCVLTALVAQWLVGSVDYIEHWGLQRQVQDGKPERMGPQHIWDCRNRVSDRLLFNLPRHASHHLQPWRHCDDLEHTAPSPQMPTGYAGMVLLAQSPRLFKRVMEPRLPKPSLTVGL